jgi:hypothetical protein
LGDDLSESTNKDRVYDSALKRDTKVTLYSDVMGSKMFGMEGSIENLSSGGLCAIFPIRPIPQEDRYLLKVTHPDTSFKVIHCKIAWSKVYLGSLMVGFQFLCMPGDTQQNLQKYLSGFLSAAS